MARPLISLVALLLAIVICAPAMAADMGVPRPKATQTQPPKAASANWTGGQLGGSNGVSSVNNNFVEPGAYVCPANRPFGVSCFETPYSFSGHPLSYTVGPFLGYRWQLGMAVFGFEADWSWKKGASSMTQSIPVICFDADCLVSRSDTKTGSVSQNWDGSVRARYGLLVTPWTLVYGTAGAAVEQITGSFAYRGAISFQTCTLCLVIPGGSTATVAASWSDTRIGATAGTGVEAELGAGWKARVEYRYTDFGHYTKTVPVATVCLQLGCSAASSAASIALRESFQTVRVGLGHDF
jgi:outer membrane immunogenic protein